MKDISGILLQLITNHFIHINIRLKRAEYIASYSNEKRQKDMIPN